MQSDAAILTFVAEVAPLREESAVGLFRSLKDNMNLRLMSFDADGWFPFKNALFPFAENRSWMQLLVKLALKTLELNMMCESFTLHGLSHVHTHSHTHTHTHMHARTCTHTHTHACSHTDTHTHTHTHTHAHTCMHTHAHRVHRN